MLTCTKGYGHHACGDSRLADVPENIHSAKQKDPVSLAAVLELSLGGPSFWKQLTIKTDA